MMEILSSVPDELFSDSLGISDDLNPNAPEPSVSCLPVLMPH